MRDVTRYLAWAVAGVVSALALVACGAGTTGPTTIRVDGAIVDGFGLGTAGVSVVIGDAPPVTTDAGGGFVVEDVTPPYDLVVYSAAEAWVHVFVGLSTATPEVIANGPNGTSGVAYSTASVGGTLPAAVGPGRIAVVCVESTERPVAGCDELAEGENAFDVAAGWAGSAPLTATVRAIVYEVDADQLPTGTASMGVAPVTLADGDAVAGVAVPLTAITSGTIDVEIVVPAGWSPTAFRAATRVGGDGELHVAPSSSPSTTTFTIALPTTGVGEHTLIAVASDGASGSIAWTGPVTAAGQLERLVLSPPTAQVTPHPGTTGVPVTAAFRVDDRPGTANVFVVEPIVAGSGPTVWVSTLEPAATLPDLALLDPALAIPAGASYAWGVFTAHGVDDAAGSDVAEGGGPQVDFGAMSLALISGFGPVPDAPGVVTQSATSPFTFE